MYQVAAPGQTLFNDVWYTNKEHNVKWMNKQKNMHDENGDERNCHRYIPRSKIAQNVCVCVDASEQIVNRYMCRNKRIVTVEQQ